MNVIDAGYLNNRGEYIEDKIYFSFGLTELEKQKILQEEYEKEQQEIDNEHGNSNKSPA